MRFQVLDIVPHLTNPVTGREISTDERLSQALTAARYAEEFGFDAVALGERHAGHFISSGISVTLGAIAATTSRVRLMTGVSVLSTSPKESETMEARLSSTTAAWVSKRSESEQLRPAA